MADWECVPGCPVDAIANQSGELRNGGKNDTSPKEMNNQVYGKGWKRSNNLPFANEKGTAARFYHQSDFSYEVAEQLAQADPMRYQAKASTERSSGLDDFYWRTAPNGFVRITQAEWEQLPNNQRAQGNIHNTVNPIMLLKYLSTLLLPPKEYAPRRLLIPFSGSGSECIAAGLAGWDEIVGIDIDPDYCTIAEARIKFWAGWSKSTGQSDVKRILEIVKNKPEKVVGQTELALIFH